MERLLWKLKISSHIKRQQQQRREPVFFVVDSNVDLLRRYARAPAQVSRTPLVASVVSAQGHRGVKW